MPVLYMIGAAISLGLLVYLVLALLEPERFQ
jgi:K+-transporting ATPase KdpF subunit